MWWVYLLNVAFIAVWGRFWYHRGVKRMADETRRALRELDGLRVLVYGTPEQNQPRR